MASSRIAELAQIISAKTAKVDKHLKEAGKPYPSFGIDALVDLGIAPDAHEVLAAKDAVLEASTELQDLLRGPRALLTPDVRKVQSSVIVHQGKVPLPAPYAGFALANNTTDTYYEFFEKNPARMARFASAISGDASQEKSRPPPPLWIGENYPWAKTFPDFATIVDVGGSEGSTCIRLAEKFPHFKFISQDLPIVIKQGESKLPAELRDRVKLMPHDFFTEQPVVADAYLIKFCLHNWPDHYVAKILKALIPALRKGAKVIVNEGVLPETGTTGLLRESDIRAHDLLMMTLFNARERELDDWKQVITDADKRFEITNVFTQSTSTTTAIEITWAG
ncbi:hypothetical protein MMC25_001795 [Agyrium rufum]|nr:hypothetical protein [Agyrium rufum]